MFGVLNIVNGDSSKEVKFSLSGITTPRIINLRDANGTLAYLSDITGGTGGGSGSANYWKTTGDTIIDSTVAIYPSLANDNTYDIFIGGSADASQGFPALIGIDGHAVALNGISETYIGTDSYANALHFDASGIDITLASGDRFIYNADYSANFNARSIIDKGYADARIASKLVSSTVSNPSNSNNNWFLKWNSGTTRYDLSTLSNGNGLTVTSGGYKLGGSITENTALQGNFDYVVQMLGSGTNSSYQSTSSVFGSAGSSTASSSIENLTSIIVNGSSYGAGVNTQTSDVIGSHFLRIYWTRPSAHSRQIELDNDGIIFSLAGSPFGIVGYNADYSANFTPRSFVDKHYVTGLTSTLSADVDNGLSKDGSTIVLGGLLINDTTIEATGTTHTNTISLGSTSFVAALGISTEYDDGFTMGSSTFEVKHFNGTTIAFDDLTSDYNEFKVGSAGIQATANGNNFAKYAFFDVSNANQYGKPDEQPQVHQQIIEEDGSVDDVLFSQYGFDVTFRNDDDDELARFIITKTGTTFTDGRATPHGIEYGGNYASDFAKHSLVDKNYVTGLTSSISVNPVVVTSGVTGSIIVDLSSGDVFILTLTGNTTFNFTGETVGKQYIFKIIKDTTEKTFTWTAGRYRFPFGTAPLMTNPTTNGSDPAHSEDIISAICTSTGRLDIVTTSNLIEN